MRIEVNHAKLDAVREFLKTKAVNGDVTRASGSMHDNLWKCMQVLEAAVAVAKQRRDN